MPIIGTIISNNHIWLMRYTLHQITMYHNNLTIFSLHQHSIKVVGKGQRPLIPLLESPLIAVSTYLRIGGAGWSWKMPLASLKWKPELFLANIFVYLNFSFQTSLCTWMSSSKHLCVPELHLANIFVYLNFIFQTSLCTWTSSS